MFIVLLLVLINLPLDVDGFEKPRAQTDYGEVVGTHGTTLKGRRYNAFYSIPYADKPIRFEEAREPKPWTNTLDATTPPPDCNQIRKGKPIGSEDCLYLNIFSPSDLNSTNPLPVTIFVHGGAFYFYSSTTFGPRYLLDKDIILVTINYRIGIFGFLCTEDEEVPGNNGLKDQVMAFGWVQRNIEYFGGDSTSVTLLGFSAGAVSIHYHYFSVLSRGLFHRGYLVGGTAFNNWAVQRNSLQKAKTYAESIGCPSFSVPKMVRCLKKAPADKLASATFLFLKFLNTPLCPWGPVIDRWSKNPFLLEYPIQSIFANRHYNVPLVASETMFSGLFPVAEFIERKDIIQQLDDNWEELGSYFLDTVDTVPQELQTQTLEQIRSFYFRGKSLIQNKSAIIKVATDRLYQADIGRSLSVHATVNPRVYFYMFNYRGAKSSSDSLSGTENNYGVSHIDDTYYLLNQSTGGPIENDRTGLKMIDAMTEMFYNFAKTGKPVFLKSVGWPPVRGEIPWVRFLRIDSPDSAVVTTSRNLGNYKFWSSLPINEPWAGRLLISS
ncbi:venom carboxylesterase-6 [Halyomorpha halys]|uniref:venom carboxylesterase-6 n=1 Tax=Halyomorpha halys TaxID=286706 RepID=UPI0006D4E54D|nr:venom carboxylesterase-6-like [Halyomorpha halys]